MCATPSYEVSWLYALYEESARNSNIDMEVLSVTIAELASFACLAFFVLSMVFGDWSSRY